MFKKLSFIFSVSFWLGACALPTSINFSDQAREEQANKLLTVVFDNGSQVVGEVASNQITKAFGLGGRSSLPWDRGMLFVYDQPGFYYFWMKGMLIPLDFIWLADGRVIDVTTNVPPPENQGELLSTFTSQAPAKYVLEVNAGWVEKNKLIIGAGFVIN